MKSTTHTARITGFLYLLVIILAGFSQGAVREVLFIAGDPSATLANIMSSPSLFRIGLVTDFTAFLLDAVISVLLYVLLKDTHKTLALVSSALRLIAHPAIGSLNLLNHYMALYLMENGHLSGDTLETVVHTLMVAHDAGYLIAGVFFGAHLLLLGILLWRSVSFPKVFGALLMLSAVGYLMESYGDFLFPGNESWLALLVGVTAAVGEVGITLYLLIKGVRK